LPISTLIQTVENSKKQTSVFTSENYYPQAVFGTVCYLNSLHWPSGALWGKSDLPSFQGEGQSKH